MASRGRKQHHVDSDGNAELPCPVSCVVTLTKDIKHYPGTVVLYLLCQHLTVGQEGHASGPKASLGYAANTINTLEHISFIHLGPCLLRTMEVHF